MAAKSVCKNRTKEIVVIIFLTKAVFDDTNFFLRSIDSPNKYIYKNLIETIKRWYIVRFRLFFKFKS